MARRRKTSLFEDFIEILGRMPWWVGIGVAVVGYLVLGSIAGSPLPGSQGGGPTAGLVTHALVRTFAMVGQFIVPVVGVIGAGVSIWRRKERRALVEAASHNQHSSAVDGISWREFEMLVGEGFRLQGYQVVETGGGGADGGVDLVLSRPGQNGSETFLVQCKQWRAQRVGVDVVRELYGIMAARGAAGGFVVTSGRFTDEAIKFAEGRNVRLIDGAKLRGLIQRPRAASPSANGSATARPGPFAEKPSPAPSPPKVDAAPSCPVCAKSMILRTAKRGANAGSAFWGCTSYPSCRGTRNAEG